VSIITRGRFNHIFIHYNGKIADITHADTNKHTLDLAAALSETRTIISVQTYAQRMSGSGDLYVLPNEGSQPAMVGSLDSMLGFCIIAARTNRLQYQMTVANDDFDLYCFGYIVEG